MRLINPSELGFAPMPAHLGFSGHSEAVGLLELTHQHVDRIGLAAREPHQVVSKSVCGDVQGGGLSQQEIRTCARHHARSRRWLRSAARRPGPPRAPPGHRGLRSASQSSCHRLFRAREAARPISRHSSMISREGAPSGKHAKPPCSLMPVFPARSSLHCGVVWRLQPAPAACQIEARRGLRARGARLG